MRIHGWKHLALFHHPDKSDDHRHCKSGDKMFLFLKKFYMITCLKGYVKLWMEAPHGKLLSYHV